MASALRRGKEILGIKDCRQNDFQVQKLRPSTAKGSWEIVLPSIFTDDEIAQQALNENTLYPLFSALGRGMSNHGYTPYLYWKICLKCVIEDTATYGAPYIHVAHLPRSVTLCYKHGVKLEGKCPSCGIAIRSHNLTSFIECSESFSEPPDALGTSHHDYALFVKRLLGFRGSTYSAAWVNRELSEKYVEVVYGSDYHLGYTSYIDDVGRFLGKEFNPRMVEYHPLDFCLALAFLGFKNADALISLIQRPSDNRRGPVIRAPYPC